MIKRNNLLLLQDMDDNTLTDLVIFDNEVDMGAVVRKVLSELWNKEDWTYEDLLKELDKFGGYCIIPTRDIEIINY